ncbi:M20/M25/M40 family metallo-hydrolase [Aurantibacter crassamenti]|uniref:M28 family metallopeptidase n=1 Tax=Aurantibacter crassamenti TaxID=1837375 RepID=UPI00193953BF|nr:M28 family peptidase [Aurantibacter crassamenti]MBM1104607.1 M20/M25/M40 family metallo-hydrolase [Aurantibacter crassamenti]
MKKIFVVCIATVFFACGTSKLRTTDPASIQSSTDDLKGNAIQSATEKTVTNLTTFSTSENVGKIISFLASDELMGREAGSEGIAKAANLIEYTFKENGIPSYFSSYRDTLTNFEGTAYNMVGFLEGNDENLKNEIVILGAHYDHIGTAQAVGQDSIANGANDNASGTTTVLELARYFSANKSNKRSIIFALFTAEEKGLLGSKHLAERLKKQDINLYTMLNFEMVGVPLQNKDYFMYVTGYQMSNLAAVANKYANENLIGYLPSAAQMNLFKRSDNYAFHLEFNVPSQTFCTFDFTNFDHYHKVGDESSIMNFDHMAEVVNKTIPAVEGIVNAPIKEIKYN